MVERGGLYGEGEKRSRALQNCGKKGEEWRIYAVLGRGRSRSRRGNRPTVASGDPVTKTRNRKGKRTWAMQDMEFGTVSSSFLAGGDPSHNWDTSDRCVARRCPSTGHYRPQDVSTSCSLEQPDRAKWRRGM